MILGVELGYNGFGWVLGALHIFVLSLHRHRFSLSNNARVSRCSTSVVQGPHRGLASSATGPVTTLRTYDIVESADKVGSAAERPNTALLMSDDSSWRRSVAMHVKCIWRKWVGPGWTLIDVP